jgi:hypothetical protein
LPASPPLPNDGPPSLSEVKARITSTKPSADLELQEQIGRQNSAAAAQHIRGLTHFYESRRQWSFFLIGCIAASLIFQISITIGVGLGALDFSKYQWFLPIVVSETFVQIVGLSAIVLKWLFSGATPIMDPGGGTLPAGHEH